MTSAETKNEIMDKETILKAIKNNRLTLRQKEDAGDTYAYAYTNAINDCIEAVNQAFDIAVVSESFIARMERIDTAAVVGDKISEEDKDYYNENLATMKQQVMENAESWKYHSKEL